MSLTHRLFLTPSVAGRRITAFVGCDGTTDVLSVGSKVASLLAFQTGKSVCFLEIRDQRRAGPRLLGANAAESNLANALLRPEAVLDLARNLGGNIWALSARTSDTQTLRLLTSARFGALISQIHANFHYAVIAAPSLLAEKASIPLCAAADATVVVLGDATQRTRAVETIQLLRSMEILIAGAVLEQKSHPRRQATHDVQQ